MKKLFLYIFLGFFFLSNSFAYYEEKIINRPYCGYSTYPDGISFKVISRFYITREDNSIFGIYTTDELGDVYEGVFFKGKLKRKTLTIITTDEHMQGELILKFSDNFNEFHGWWVGDNGSSQGSWEGKAGDFCVE